jgi:putative CocE/NonD family hydrolase
MMRSAIASWIAAGLICLGSTRAAAQGNRTPVDLSEHFQPKVDVMIPMRDGVRLHTEIYYPKGATGLRPIMLERTPYYANPGEQQRSSRLQFYSEFFDDGYVFVLQDLRGRYLSQGLHVTLRPQRTDPAGIDESTDFYDTIDWLVKNVPANNGRVGTLGISYGGFLSLRAMMDPHPALKAVSPQAACADMFIGDDFHHNGAFRLHYSFVAAVALETPRSYNALWDRYDLYQWGLDLGPLSNVNRHLLLGQSPLWNAFESHPDLDDTWERQVCGVFPHLQGVTVPALHVLGWFDSEDFYGPLEVYRRLEKDDPRRRNHLVIGPWTHGGWTFDEEGRKVSQLDFGAATGRDFRRDIHRRWFARWLKDQPLDLAEATVFQTGSNTWERFERWPPATAERKVYLRAGGRLAFEAPIATADEFASWTSDPAKPVPFQRRPIRYPEGWAEWQGEDQRVAHGRPDVMTWVSDPLAEDLALTGDPVAKLFASTSGTDADWVVKLIDVHPDDYQDAALRGYQFMVAGEVFRARYRNDFRRPEPVPAGQVIGYTINLRDRSHRFRRGHRLMVQIQSSWFPLIARNPQRYVPNIFHATAEDYQSATHRVHFSARYPTHLVLPLRLER